MTLQNGQQLQQLFDFRLRSGTSKRGHESKHCSQQACAARLDRGKVVLWKSIKVAKAALQPDYPFAPSAHRLSNLLASRAVMSTSSIARFRIAGLAFVFLWFFIGGIAHFVLTQLEMRIVPPYIPSPRLAVLGSGVFELLGALAILWRPIRRAGGVGLLLLTLAVTPCHVYMLQTPELFPTVPIWALWARLPVQLLLLMLIAWCTIPRSADLAPRAFRR